MYLGNGHIFSPFSYASHRPLCVQMWEKEKRKSEMDGQDVKNLLCVLQPAQTRGARREFRAGPT